LPEYFGKLPRMTYGVKPVPASLARWVALVVMLQACRCGPSVDPAAPAPSEKCAACHRTLFEQWAAWRPDPGWAPPTFAAIAASPDA